MKEGKGLGGEWGHQEAGEHKDEILDELELDDHEMSRERLVPGGSISVWIVTRIFCKRG
jgi:hypothetical protein